MVIGVPIPNNYFAPWEAVKCFLEVATTYPITYSQGPYIYDNRNQLLKFAKSHDQAILMIDSDIIFSMVDVLKMEGHLIDKDIVTGVYCLGTAPYPAAILEKKEKHYRFVPPPTELAEIDACGGGFLGISQKVVREMNDHAFDNVWEAGVPHGEDISFCHRAKEKGFKVWCDPTIRLGQVRSGTIYYGYKG